MPEPVELPVMNVAQRQSWHALMELYQRISSNWALIGGQLVHLHCAERGVSPTRPTNDADAVVGSRLPGGRPVEKGPNRLRKMLLACRDDSAAMSLENAAEALVRLERAAKLDR
ncbi:hypothetical protein ABEG17_10640 [Pedococcus sp. KACC 23699]|uniref:Uncharacterized protein n=1 Tax=Pedococcus sp. KACC 23699 TaxID=3149228 RepID=A0AAU7JPF4_9MICO